MEPYYTDLDSTTMETSKSIKELPHFHKLQDKWNFWAHLPHDQDWSIQSYKKIYQFNNVEESVAIIESFPPDLVKNCMLFIMKDGIAPVWEDPINRNGGCFSYKISNKYVVDVWKELFYVLIGNTISSNINVINSLTGITISPKKNFCVVKIWLSNCNYQNPQLITNEIKNLTSVGCLFKKHTPEF